MSEQRNVAFRDINLTPRTDAQERALGLAWFGLTNFLGRAQNESAKYRELARTLERELAEANAARAPMPHSAVIDNLNEQITALKLRLSDVTIDRDNARGTLDYVMARLFDIVPPKPGDGARAAEYTARIAVAAHQRLKERLLESDAYAVRLKRLLKAVVKAWGGTVILPESDAHTLRENAWAAIRGDSPRNPEAETALEIGADIATPARELLALYDWRPVIAERENKLRRDGTDAQDEVREVRRMLREYGERKKAGWIALRAALAKNPMETPSQGSLGEGA